MSESMTQLYLLNLVVTAAMFSVLIFRAWIELRNYRIIWREMEWRKNCEAATSVLRTEKESILKIEGGEELYKVLSQIFEMASS